MGLTATSLLAWWNSLLACDNYGLVLSQRCLSEAVTHPSTDITENASRCDRSNGTI